MITINTSEIAALVGKNPYKNAEEAIQDLINRNRGAMSVADQKSRDICKNNAGVDRLCRKMVAKARSTNSTLEVATVKQNYHEGVDKLKATEVKKITASSVARQREIDTVTDTKMGLARTRGAKRDIELQRETLVSEEKERLATLTRKTETDMEHMKEVGNRHTNTQFGTRHEDSVADMFHAQTGNTIVKDNARQTWEFMDGFLIVGRFDGFTDTGTLVEIKNRMNRLFLKVPEYERVQVHVYMQLAEVEEAIVIERFGKAIAIHEMKRDEKFMGEIMDGLRDICTTKF